MKASKETLPKHAFKCDGYMWIIMEDEKPMNDKQAALTRKRELGEYKDKVGYRIIKHQNKHYLYERKR